MLFHPELKTCKIMWGSGKKKGGWVETKRDYKDDLGKGLRRRKGRSLFC